MFSVRSLLQNRYCLRCCALNIQHFAQKPETLLKQTSSHRGDTFRSKSNPGKGAHYEIKHHVARERDIEMPIDTRELMEAIAIVADERNVRVAVKQSGKGAAICAACSFAGGMLLGPVGLAVGGAAGGIAAYKMTSGTFRPLGEVILNDLTDRQREQLVEHVSKAVAEIHPTDIVMLLPLIVQNASIQQAVLNTVVSFVSNELRMQIVD